MADRTLDIIKVRGITVQDFKDRLINLNVRNREQHKEFLDKVIFSDKNAESVKDVWRKLSDYWDFLNYTLLEHLIKKYGDRNLLAAMRAYKKRLEMFRCQTRLCDFAEHFKDIRKGVLQEKKDLLKKFVVVKLERNWKNCSLQDLENWKECLTHKLLLPSFITILEDISQGSVSITWAIPAMFTPSLVEKLKTLDENFCKEHKIMSLSLDGVEYLGGPDKDTGEFYAVHTDMD